MFSPKTRISINIALVNNLMPCTLIVMFTCIYPFNDAICRSHYNFSKPLAISRLFVSQRERVAMKDEGLTMMQ